MTNDEELTPHDIYYKTLEKEAEGQSPAIQPKPIPKPTPIMAEEQLTPEQQQVQKDYVLLSMQHSLRSGLQEITPISQPEPVTTSQPERIGYIDYDKTVTGPSEEDQLSAVQYYMRELDRKSVV